MTATNPAEQKALTLPQRAAVALGEAANMAKLRELAAQSAGILAVTNPDGREEAHRAGMVLRTTRTNITNTGKAAREDAVAFGKAVIAMEKDLIAIIEPEETRVLALRDAFDEKLAAEKAAKIAAERARTDAIQADIQAIRDTPNKMVLKGSADLAAAIEAMRAIEVSAERFAEFIEAAQAAIDEADHALVQMHGSKVGAELAAAEAEQARIAEAARIEAARIENERVAAENARAAAELAAERKRMADEEAARLAAAAEVQKRIDADAKAARDEQAKVAAETKRQLEAQQAAIAEAQRKLAEQQAAADARDAAALDATKAAEAKAAQQLIDDQQREADHGPALMMNAEFDVARDAALEAERQRLQAMTDQAQDDKHEPMPSLDALLDDVEEPLTDGEIIDMVMEVFSLSREDAIDRLQAIDFAAAREA